MKEQISKLIEPSAVVSWPVFGITLGWAIFVNFLDTLNNPPTLFLERIIAITLVHVALFAMLFISLKFTQRLRSFSRSLVLLGLIVLFTAIRGLNLALVFTLIRGDELSGIAFRAVSSIPVIGLAIIVSSIVLQQVRTYSTARQAILNERKRVVTLTLETEKQIRELADFRVSAIKEAVLDSLASSDLTTNERTVEAIENTVENIVRPLSHQLEKESGIVVAEIESLNDIRLDWGEALRSAFLATQIKPKAVALGFFIMGSTRIIFFQTLWESVYLLSMATFGSWGLLLLLKRGLSQIPDAYPKALASGAFVLGVTAAGFLVGGATLPAMGSSPQPFSLFFQAPFFLFAITALVALASSTQAEAAATNHRFEQTTAELSWEVTRLLDEHRQLKRHLAKALHGPIQSQLFSSLIKLDRSGSFEDQSLQRIRGWLTTEFQSIQDAMRTGQLKSPKSIQEIFMEVGSLWEGVAVIELQGTQSVADSLALDPRLMLTLGELIPELCFNAVKHGGASSMVFKISFTDPRALSLSCTDNGSRPAENSRVGLGTKLLDECAISWRRYQVDDHTTTEIELPFARADEVETASSL
jgi:two-component sensor histidine kinase